MMERLTETIYEVLFHPGRAMKQFSEENRLWEAMVVFLCTLLLPAWVVYLTLQASGMGKMAGVVFVAQVGCSFFLWILGAAFFQLVSECLGGKGTALGLLAATGFAHLPRLFIVPILVLSGLMSGTAATVLTVLAGLVIGCWVVVLYIKAIKGVHDLSTPRAVLVFFSPVAVIICGIILILIGMGIGMLH